MSHSKFGLKALGLCLLAALSVMAFAATGAQANGHWFVNGELLKTTIGVESLELEHTQLLSKFGLTAVAILCEKILVHDGLLFSDGSSLGELLFSKNCKTELNAKVTENCKPLEPIVAEVKNLLIKHPEPTKDPKSYILFSPHDSLTFATLHLGALCAIGQNIEVKGNVVAECGVLNTGVWTQLDCAQEKVEQRIREVQSKTLFPNDVLKFGVNPALLDGDVGLVLSGTHAGGSWGGLAF
jgi:hypothetical protein